MIPKNKKNKCSQIVISVFVVFGMTLSIAACKKKQATTPASSQPVAPIILQTQQSIQKNGEFCQATVCYREPT